MPLLSPQSPVPLRVPFLSTAAPEIFHLETAPAEKKFRRSVRNNPVQRFFFQPIEAARDLGMRILRDQIEMQILINVAEERECC